MSRRYSFMFDPSGISLKNSTSKTLKVEVKYTHEICQWHGKRENRIPKIDSFCMRS